MSPAAPYREVLAAYAALLGTVGVERGLIGPREIPRLWDRHLLNCAVVADPGADLVPEGAHVVDVGSGAGLPGLVWALTRPDLTVTLVEPLLRRATFLTEAVADLGLTDRVTVQRARAEEAAGTLAAPVVTARAVAPLARLVGWALPLVAPGGTLLALKGRSAEEELIAARAALADWPVASAEVVECGAGVVDPPTRVVRIVLGGTPMGENPATSTGTEEIP